MTDISQLRKAQIVYDTTAILHSRIKNEKPMRSSGLC